MLSDLQYTRLWLCLGYALGAGYCKQPGVKPGAMQDWLTKYDMTKAEKAEMLKMVEYAENQGLLHQQQFLNKDALADLKATLARESA